MTKKICVAGNIVVDVLYPVTGYPKPGQLTTILDGISRSTGGAVCNVAMDLAVLAPDIKVIALGMLGDDAEGRFAIEKMNEKGIDTSLVNRNGKTSFTAVMADKATNERTFFHYRGANAQFSEDMIDWDSLDCDLLHIGYILLLDSLDREDSEYGTKMARLLANAKKHGIMTSVDVVTENSERFSRLVPPALKYTDYCIINEAETEATTGIPLRDENGMLLISNMRPALEKLHEMGVSKWAVIHAPEGGFGLDENGNYYEHGRLNYPNGWIKGTVGAGDAFCAGVLCAAEKGMSLDEAIYLGTCAAVASLSEPGANEGMKTAAEVLEMGNRMGEVKLK